MLGQDGNALFVIFDDDKTHVAFFFENKRKH
jgi:hypothetical protein